MDYTTLRRGQAIQDEKKDLSSVLDHLNKWQSGKDDPIEFISNYLNKCRMVGTTSIKKELAISFIEDAKTHMTTRIKMLDEEFEKL